MPDETTSASPSTPEGDDSKTAFSTPSNEEQLTMFSIWGPPPPGGGARMLTPGQLIGLGSHIDASTLADISRLPSASRFMLLHAKLRGRIDDYLMTVLMTLPPEGLRDLSAFLVLVEENRQTVEACQKLDDALDALNRTWRIFRLPRITP
jgi:hypothetical protein